MLILLHNWDIEHNFFVYLPTGQRLLADVALLGGGGLMAAKFFGGLVGNLLGFGKKKSKRLRVTPRTPAIFFTRSTWRNTYKTQLPPYYPDYPPGPQTAEPPVIGTYRPPPPPTPPPVCVRGSVQASYTLRVPEEILIYFGSQNVVISSNVGLPLVWEIWQISVSSKNVSGTVFWHINETDTFLTDILQICCTFLRLGDQY